MATADDVETRWGDPSTRRGRANNAATPPKTVPLLAAVGVGVLVLVLLLVLQAAAIMHLAGLPGMSAPTDTPTADAVSAQQAKTSSNTPRVTRRAAEDDSGSVWDAVQALRKVGDRVLACRHAAAVLLRAPACWCAGCNGTAARTVPPHWRALSFAVLWWQPRS